MKKLFCALTCGMLLQSVASNAFAGVRVQLKDNDGTPTSEWMRLEFKVVNDQPYSYDLSNTTLRYYFRDTSKVWSTALWSFLVNSSVWNTGTITATVAPEPLLQDGWVLTLKFSSGKIDPNRDAWVLVGVHNENWKVNEVDDYSYLTGTVFQDDENVAFYDGDEQVFGPAVLAAPAGNGSAFSVTTNPIISFDDRKHYSSDPVATVVPLGGPGTPDVLFLATSTDLYSSQDCGGHWWWPPDWFKSNCGNDWPMDGIHLYSTSSQNFRNDAWFEEGNVNSDNTVDPVLALKDFPGANVNAQHMFAPDLQFVPQQNAMFMYIPMEGSDGKWHIGTAKTAVRTDGSFVGFTPSPAFLELSHGDQFNAPNSPIDPGVFPAIVGGAQTGHFMMYVDASKGTFDTTKGNISMAQLNGDMVSGAFMGKVSFALPYTNYKLLVNYLEGPDVSILRTSSGRARYYMVFAAADASNLIGYATASTDEFDRDPKGSWNFKGWIFQDLGTGNNHANLVRYNGKNYILYHRGFTDRGNHRRQVWAKEITLVDNPNADPSLPGDGEIVGVTRPTIDSIDKLELYGSLNGTTTTIDRTTQYIRNAISNDTAWSYVTLATEDTFKEGEGIYNRFLTKGSTNQEWIFENVPANTVVGGKQVPANAVRIKNMLTPDKRMNCGARWNTDAEGDNFGLFNNTLNATSANQVWVKESVANLPGTVRLRNLGNNLFLTRIKSGQADTFCKAAVAATATPERQRWFIE